MGDVQAALALAVFPSDVRHHTVGLPVDLASRGEADLRLAIWWRLVFAGLRHLMWR
jgi:hypothetical protein